MSSYIRGMCVRGCCVIVLTVRRIGSSADGILPNKTKCSNLRAIPLLSLDLWILDRHSAERVSTLRRYGGMHEYHLSRILWETARGDRAFVVDVRCGIVSNALFMSRLSFSG